MKSKFFVFEGLDGSGKTTVLEKLKVEFPHFVFTREPGGSEFGERVREVLLDPKSKNVPALPHFLGFMAARASNFQELILPALEKDLVVVSDRFDASTFAFQICGQQNGDLADLFWKLRGRILWTSKERRFYPHYVYLRIDPNVASERRLVRQGDGKENHFDLQKEEFHKRVFLGYEKFFGELRRSMFYNTAHCLSWVHTVDASLGQEEVYQQAKKIILGLV